MSSSLENCVVWEQEAAEQDADIFKLADETAVTKFFRSRHARDAEAEILHALADLSPLTPKPLLKREIDGRFVLVKSFLPGVSLASQWHVLTAAERLTVLESAGRALGSIQGALDENKLRELPIFESSPFANIANSRDCWREALSAQIKKWSRDVVLTQSDLTLDFVGTLQGLNELNETTTEPCQIGLLHNNYCGHNILIDSASLEVTGIVGFEAAHVGDRSYDLAQIIWENIQLQSLPECLALTWGWERASGIDVSHRTLSLYVGMQALAAMARCDTMACTPERNALRLRARDALITLRINDWVL